MFTYNQDQQEGTTARCIIKGIETMTIKAYRKETDTLVFIDNRDENGRYMMDKLGALYRRHAFDVKNEIERLGWELVAISHSSEYGGAGWCISRRGRCNQGRDYVTHSWSVNAQGQACLVSGHYDLSVVGAYTSLQERTL